jgi:hypothetical protein
MATFTIADDREHFRVSVFRFTVRRVRGDDENEEMTPTVCRLIIEIVIIRAVTYLFLLFVSNIWPNGVLRRCGPIWALALIGAFVTTGLTSILIHLSGKIRRLFKDNRE